MPRLDPHALELDPAHRDALAALLAQHVPQAEVWAYGSRVTGQGHEGSDLDLVLRNPAALATPVDGAAALRQALQNSRLPMSVEVHQWAYLPHDFHAEIEHAYILLHTPRTPTP